MVGADDFLCFVIQIGERITVLLSGSINVHFHGLQNRTSNSLPSETNMVFTPSSFGNIFNVVPTAFSFFDCLNAPTRLGIDLLGIHAVAGVQIVYSRWNVFSQLFLD